MDFFAELAQAAPSASWPNLVTWTGILVFGFMSVIQGWLVPKRSHEREIGILEKRITELIAEKNEWRAAYQAEQAVGRERDAQHRLLLETGKTTAYAVDAIRTGLTEPSKDVTSP